MSIPSQASVHLPAWHAFIKTLEDKFTCMSKQLLLFHAHNVYYLFVFLFEKKNNFWWLTTQKFLFFLTNRPMWLFTEVSTTDNLA